jgi:hypothetical protein
MTRKLVILCLLHIQVIQRCNLNAETRKPGAGCGECKYLVAQCEQELAVHDGEMEALGTVL